MASLSHPLQFLLVALAGWLNRHQQQTLEYLIEENRVLREQLGGRRVRLNDDQRRRLAAKGRPLGRRMLSRVATLVTPDTILRWHRQLIARKWSYGRHGPCRTDYRLVIRKLVVQMATENPRWGYSRIRGALRNLGHRVARSTIARILKEHGIEPAPKRPTPWSTFLRAHWGEVVATDFLTVEVWTPFGLVTHYVLFFIDLKTRRILFSEVTQNPNDAFMVGVARYLTDPIFGCLARARLLICDHDGNFTQGFRDALSGADIRVVQTHRWAPNCNAYAERFVRSIKEECLERMIFFGAGRLERAVQQYVEHYNRERNHQGLGNRLIEPTRLPRSGTIRCRERLGGMLRYYHRAA